MAIPSALSRHLCLALLPLALLAGCAESVTPTFAPACPRASVLKSAETLTRYAPRGQDLSDLVLVARMTGLAGKCGPGPEHVLRVQATLALDITRGPAAEGRTAEVPYFVALVQGDRILRKQVTVESVTFPSNVDEVRVDTRPVSLLLATPRGVTGAEYQIWIGFQKTEAEERNRVP